MAQVIKHERIGLIGKAGSGKSTVAAFLNSEFGFQHCRTGYLCREVTKLIYGDESSEHLHQVSDALQALDERIFLDAAMRGVDMARPIVVDALRFEHDLCFARESGFVLIRVLASDEIRSRRLAARGQVVDLERDRLHPIEMALDGVVTDYQLINEDDEEQLKAAVCATLCGA